MDQKAIDLELTPSVNLSKEEDICTQSRNAFRFGLFEKNQRIESLKNKNITEELQ